MTPFLVILGLELTAGEVLAIAGGISLLIAAKQINDFLANPDNARRLNFELENIGEKLGEMAKPGAVGAASTESAAKALEGLRESRRHLEVLGKQLQGTAEVGQQLLNKVTGLLNQIDNLTADLSTQVQLGPVSVAEPPPSVPPVIPAYQAPPISPTMPDISDFGRRELAKPLPIPINGTEFWRDLRFPTQTSTHPSPDRPLIPHPTLILPNDFGQGSTTPPKEPSRTAPPPSLPIPTWRKPNYGRIPDPRTVRPLPSDGLSLPDFSNVQPLPSSDATGFPRSPAIPQEITQAPTDTNQPRCQEPDSWIETFKQLLKEFGEELGEELGQQAIEDMSDRAGKQFQEAFEARAEAIRRNPNFDKDKPDLAALMKQVIGKKYSDLSPDVVRDLKKYYEVVNNPDGSIKLNRHKGHGGGKDPTLPLIQFHKATGRIIPESINRRANGPNLSAEYAKQHGFNPGVGKVFEQQANIRSQLQGAVQFHHLITWSTWASHELTQAIQSQINQLPASQRKGVPGRDHGLNLIAAFRSPESRQAYENALRTNPTAAQNIQQLQARGNFLTEVFHNGSHPGWDRHVQDVLAEQVKSLKRDHPGKKLSEMPPAALNKAYENAVTTLRNDLNRVNQKIRDRRPLTDKESDWTKDYCPTPESEPHHRISQTPQRNQVSMPNLGRAYEESRASTSANVGFRMADIQELALRQFEADPRWRKRKAMAQELAMETPSAQASQMNGSSNPIWGELLQSARTLNEFNNQQVDTNPSQSPAIAETIQSAHHKIQGGFEIG
jgi:hypothetical protein